MDKRNWRIKGSKTCLQLKRLESENDIRNDFQKTPILSTNICMTGLQPLKREKEWAKLCC